jgi:glycerophosphoryl diester phosphodiesterase
MAPRTLLVKFSFPYFTIENVQVLGPDTLLVANDNNYPATGGRGADVKDQTEFLWIKLPTALKLAPAYH